ncbi:TetR/AcrR family transcriptional regulator [Nocardia higoensis]|uniref:TetR/AcrR family transcriptional regulator n=1 Tax=Nocardia higoensis TaxID=228599 RepID=A0ABS0DJE8_9NOCA|nr:WHG domain-containing protein [Nocardia higoensis]MBF6357707.1 TetR/AcrR family transcriptional regulator [Nocardia higoensis]
MSASAEEPSRRDVRRQETIEEIKSRARRQLAERGAGGLSLRAVARDMRMSSAAIYRYFANQSDLIGALCVDAYLALGDEFEAVRDRSVADDPSAQCWAIGQAARQWALRNSQDFALIFGTPIAGYHAAESVTGPAAGRAASIPLLAYAAAVDAGAADLDRCIVPDTVEPGELGVYLLTAHPSGTPIGMAADRLARMAAVGLNAWASILGFLTSEQFGNLPRLITNVDDLYDAHLRTVMRDMGFQPEVIEAHAR